MTNLSITFCFKIFCYYRRSASVNTYQFVKFLCFFTSPYSCTDLSFKHFIIHGVSKIYGQCYFWFLRASFLAERTDSSPFSPKVHHHHHLSVKQSFLYSWPRSAKVKGRLAAMIEKAPLANLSAEIVSGPFDVVVDHKCKSWNCSNRGHTHTKSIFGVDLDAACIFQSSDDFTNLLCSI